MLDLINRLMADLSARPEEQDEIIHDRKQLAEAALMFHIIAVDGVVRDSERQRLTEILSEQFGLSTDETAQLAETAAKADAGAVDLYGFTSILKRTLSEPERIAIVENLWEMVYADGVVHELEDNAVWRIAELLNVDSRERMLLKQRVRDRNQDNPQT